MKTNGEEDAVSFSAGTTDLWRPDHPTINALKVPDYAESEYTLQAKYSHLNLHGDELLNQGSWLDTYLAGYGPWSRQVSDGAGYWRITRIAVWDVHCSYVVGFGLSFAMGYGTGKPSDKVSRELIRHWWNQLSADKQVVSRMLRDARRYWAKHQEEVLKGAPPKFDTMSRNAAKFHVALANMRLDEDSADYRIHMASNGLVVSPLGIDYLVSQHKFVATDCFAPLFLGKRNASNTKRIWQGACGPGRKDSTYSAVIYFELT